MIEVLALVAYAAVGSLAARNTLMRMKARYPSLPLDGADLAFAVILSGLAWPIGYPASFTALPSLRSYSRVKRVRAWSRLNQWAERATKEMVE